ncbi:MAG: outer membrane beta-barrel protein [Verrucomicrobiota bacterium]
MKSVKKIIVLIACALPCVGFAGNWAKRPVIAPVPAAPTGYIFAYGGFASGHTVDGNEPVFPSNEIVDIDDGYLVGGGAGAYSRWLGGSRFEIEGLWAHNDIGRIRSDILDGRGFINFGFRGQLSTRAMMFNVLKEIPLNERVVGYVGAGIGAAETNINIAEPFEPQGFARGFSENDLALAYQFIAGVDFPITDSMALFLQYKLLGIGQTEYQYLDFNIDPYFTHNFVFGARLSF